MTSSSSLGVRFPSGCDATTTPGEECPLRKLDKLPSHALRVLIPCGDRLNHVDAAGAPDVGESGVFGTAQSSRAAEGGLRVPRRIAGG
jgi:hypothetical protein